MSLGRGTRLQQQQEEGAATVAIGRDEGTYPGMLKERADHVELRLPVADVRTVGLNGRSLWPIT